MGEIRLEAVRKQFGDTVAVEDITLTVEAGQFVTLLGPSGCGKSTTLSMIAGLEDVTSGAIVIDGHRVEELPPDRRDLAFVFQDYALYPHMSVRDNLAFGLKMRKVPRPEISERVADAARWLDIEHLLDRKPRQLSGGQRQRVALGRAIVRRPSVFLFDEPLSNLDALLRDSTRAEIKRLHQELRATSVYVTHDQEEALTLSDRIAVLNRGRLEQYGTPEEIYRRPATEYVAAFVGKPHINLFDARRVERGRFRVEGTELVVEAPEGLPDVVRFGLRPDELDVELSDAADGTGRVTLVEPVGSATDVTVDLGGTHVVVRAGGFRSLAVGDQVRVAARGADAHFFAPGSGERLVGTAQASIVA